MFETGVLNFGDLAIIHEEEGNQVNGAVLGDQCALFLARFLAQLIISYNETMEQLGLEAEGPIDQEAYSTAITATLRDFCA